MQESFDELAVDGTTVRTLDSFSVYDKFGNMIHLNDILEKPYYSYKDEVIAYGTVISPLPESLRAAVSTLFP